MERYEALGTFIKFCCSLEAGGEDLASSSNADRYQHLCWLSGLHFVTDYRHMSPRKESAAVS